MDISLPLWSARALIDAPQVLLHVHRDYLDAGADAITAATFRTHRRTLAKAGLGDRAGELTHQAVRIARQARDGRKPGALVLGSMAPLEDCYRPDLAPPESACRAEHAELAAALAGAGADAILIETMNNLTESAAAADAARQVGAPWMISFCTAGQGPPGVLLSGEAIAPLLEEFGDAAAVGVNCVAAPAVEAQVRFLRDRLPDAVRVMAYANIGDADDAGNWITTDAVSPDRYAAYARTWIDAGATIIGGCCGTTPETIRAIREELEE